jgi:hypothetical protein
LVASGLLLDPDNVVGHLLAGSLHPMLREMGKARTSFERLLALEPTHPRALLGLARISLEEGDTGACTDLVRRALARYPDFPEAKACSTSLGLLIAAQLPGEIAPEPLSALAAILGRELELRGPRLRRGTFPMAQFASGTGIAFLGSTPVGYIVLLGDASADRDTIRSALRSAVGTVHRAWAG